MKVTRWPALAFFIVIMIAAFVLEDDEGISSIEQVFERNQAFLVGDRQDLSSTWYCVSGTVGGSGIADHEILLGNPSNKVANASITVIPVLSPNQLSTENDEPNVSSELKILQLPNVTTDVIIPERSTFSIKLSDIEGVNGEHAAAFIQSDLGDVVAEHRLSGKVGVSQSFCSSNASTEWNFAAGTTRSGSREIISIYNPFPDNAVLDITFAADGRTRRPEAFNGLVVPPNALLPIDITDVVTLAETIGARIETRIGRVVAERMLFFGDEFDPRGLSSGIGSPTLNNIWVFPGGFDTESNSSLVVYNPSSSSEAEVEVEIISDVKSGPYIEPVNISVKPGSLEQVIFGGGSDPSESASKLDVSDRIPRGVPFWVVVRSLNEVPIVSERFGVTSESLVASSGSNMGIDLAAREHFFISNSSGGKLAVVLPAEDRLTLLQLFAYSEGKIYESQIIEVSAKSRKIIDLQQLGIPEDALIRVTSSEPVALERYLLSQMMGQWDRVAAGTSGLVELEISPQPFE